MENEQLKYFLISQTASVVNAMQKIDENAKGILFVVNDEQKLVGVITDGDIRRWLIKTGNLQEHLEKIMNRNPRKIYPSEVHLAKEILNKCSVQALPIVTSTNKITDVFFKDETVLKIEQITTNSLNNVSVIIMAGGKGTRLYPYTKILPKPLIPIDDVPIIERIINTFRNFGVNKFYATINYRKSMIKSYFSEIKTDYQLTYIEEEKPLGTAGSLYLIEGKINEPFIVTNCDILINANYAEIYEYHIKNQNELTIVASLKNIVIPYGVIHSSEHGKISSIEEKPELPYLVNTGMYILNAVLLQEIPKDTFFHMTDLVNQLLEQNRKVGMYPISENAFLDMGELEELHRMEQKLEL